MVDHTPWGLRSRYGDWPNQRSIKNWEIYAGAGKLRGAMIDVALNITMAAMYRRLCYKAMHGHLLIDEMDRDCKYTAPPQPLIFYKQNIV